MRGYGKYLSSASGDDVTPSIVASVSRQQKSMALVLALKCIGFLPKDDRQALRMYRKAAEQEGLRSQSILYSVDQDFDEPKPDPYIERPLRSNVMVPAWCVAASNPKNGAGLPKHVGWLFRAGGIGRMLSGRELAPLRHLAIIS